MSEGSAGALVLTGVARLCGREGSGGEVQPSLEKENHQVAMQGGHAGPVPGSRGQLLVRQPGPQRDPPQPARAERTPLSTRCALASCTELGSQLSCSGNFRYRIPAHPKELISLPEASAGFPAPKQKGRAPGLATKSPLIQC